MRSIKLVGDERGSMLVLTAGFIFIGVLILAIVVDFGRFTVVKEKLQTAGDAASLAAAKSVDRMVRIEIDRGSYRSCCGSRPCTPCCVDCGTITVVGREAYLIDAAGWRSYCCNCGCGGMEILDRWVNHTGGGNDAVTAARIFFDMNTPHEVELSNGGDVFLTVDTTYLSETQRSSPLYPTVFINAQGRIKTLLLGFFDSFAPGMNVSEMEMSVCSQGRTYYRDVGTGKWSQAPDNQCVK